MNSFSSAKKIMDFYMSKLAESNTEEAEYALQYAMLQQLKFRTNACLDSLNSYSVEVE